MVPEAKKSDINLEGCVFTSSSSDEVRKTNEKCIPLINTILIEIHKSAVFTSLSKVQNLFKEYLFKESGREIQWELKVFFEHLLKDSTPDPKQFETENGKKLFECYVNEVRSIYTSVSATSERAKKAPEVVREMSNILTQTGKHATASSVQPQLYYKSLKPV